MKQLIVALAFFSLPLTSLAQTNWLLTVDPHKFYVSTAFDANYAGIRVNAGDLVVNSKTGGALWLNRDSNSEVQLFSGSNEFYFTPGSLFYASKAGIRVSSGDMVVNAKTGGTVLFNRDVIGDVEFQSQGVTLGRFSNSGTNKLSVCGKIRADEIKVDLLGCDFVFESTYKLMPLQDLERFIESKKHLPDIQSAAEMEMNGVELGDLNSKLLQKIEELTLYVIDLNKKVENLEKENRLLKK